MCSFNNLASILTNHSTTCSNSVLTLWKLTCICKCLPTYLPDVLHHEGTPLDLPHGLHAPAAAVVRAEDAHRVLPPVLHDPVATCRVARATFVTLVDWNARPHAHTPALVVGELGACVGPAAGLTFVVTVRALAADDRVLRDVDARHRLVIIDICELIRRAFHVDLVLDNDRRRVGVDLVQMQLPRLQRLLHFALQLAVRSRTFVRYIAAYFRRQPHPAGRSRHPARRDQLMYAVSERRRRLRRRRHRQELLRGYIDGGCHQLHHQLVDATFRVRLLRRYVVQALPLESAGTGAFEHLVEGREELGAVEVFLGFPRVVLARPTLPLDQVELILTLLFTTNAGISTAIVAH